MLRYKVKKSNFHVFWSVSNDLKACPYVEFSVGKNYKNVIKITLVCIKFSSDLNRETNISLYVDPRFAHVSTAHMHALRAQPLAHVQHFGA